MRISIGIAFVIGLLFAAPAKAEELRPQLDDMVEHFVEVVFGVEYANLTAKPTGLSRWAGPQVGIFVQGRLSQPLVDLAGKHLGVLARESKLGFRQIKSGDAGPNIQIVFLNRNEMGALKGGNVDQRVIQSMAADPTMVCYFITWKSPPETIVKALVVVNVEADPVRIDACLLEELTQVMGLPNDVQTYWTSMFNPNDASTAHSPWDRLYVRTLYDPRLKPGMSPDAVREVVRPIFAKALSNGQ